MALMLALLGVPAWARDDKVEPKALPVNSADDEDHAHVADAGQTLYFTRTTKGKEVLRVAKRKGTAWASKSDPIESSVQNKGDIRGAWATAGGYPRYLYFAARDEEGKNYDLFVGIQDGRDKVFTAVKPVANACTPADEAHPWLGDGGKSLWFSRKTKDGWKVFVSRRASAATGQGWREPEEAGLPAGFHHAALTPKGDTMFLQGPLEKDRWGLFVSRRAGKGWGEPKPLEMLNSAEG
ncbi:MAG: hypothetical protein K2W96_03160, partial [Gemmataceae bacterium]|nr:hypothetical protein [Gemmataceae bacterium]